MFWLAFSRAPKNAQNGTEWQQAILLPSKGSPWKCYQAAQRSEGYPVPVRNHKRLWPIVFAPSHLGKKIVVDGLWYRFLDFCVGCSKSIKPHEPKVPWPGWSLFIRMFSLELAFKGIPEISQDSPLGFITGVLETRVGWIPNFETRAFGGEESYGLIFSCRFSPLHESVLDRLQLQ